MGRVFKILAICLASVFIVGTTASIICYYEVPSYQEWVKDEVFHIEKEDTSDKDEKIVELQVQITEKETIIAEINTQLAAEKDKVEALESAAQENAETIATLQNNITVKEDSINTLASEKTALEAQIEELNTSVANKQETISSLEQENVNLETRISEMSADLEANSAEIAELNSQIEINNETINSLNSEIESMNVDITNYQTEIENKTTQINNLTAEVNALTQERDDAVNNLSVKQAELDEVQANVTTIQNELNSKYIEIASLNARIEELESGYIDSDKIYLDSLNNNGLQSIEFYNVGSRTLVFPSYLNTITAGVIKGIYELNPDYSLNTLYEKYNGWKVVDVYPNGDLLLRDTMYGQLLKYVKADNVIEEIITGNSLRSYNVAKVLSNGNIFYFTSGVSNQYAYVLDVETKESTKIETSIGSMKDYALVLTDAKVLLSGYNSDDLILVDAINFTVETISSSYPGISEKGFALSNGGALLAKKVSGLGLYYYNPETKTLTTLLDDCSCPEYYSFGDENIAVSDDSAYTYMFNTETQELTLIFNRFFAFETGQVKTVVSSNNSHFICENVYSMLNGNLLGTHFIIYDGDNKTLTSYYSYYKSYYDTCVLEENGFRISSSSGGGVDLFYDFSTKTLENAA